MKWPEPKEGGRPEYTDGYNDCLEACKKAYEAQGKPELVPLEFGVLWIYLKELEIEGKIQFNQEMLALDLANKICSHFGQPTPAKVMTVDSIIELLENKFRMVQGITVLEGDKNEHYVEFKDLANAIFDRMREGI